MSLKVWLPLNGDLHNQGLSNITMVNTNATINSNGKIGQCYTFNGSAYLRSSSTLNFNSNILSLAGWAKISSSSSGYMFGFSNASSPEFMLYANGTQLRYYINGSNTANIDDTAYFDTWHHYALTSDGEIIRLYIDGQLKQTTTKTATVFGTEYVYIGARRNGSNTSARMHYQGDINDVRIYDHCLSPKEVEEIAKGLVLHYKLDQNLNIFHQDNLSTVYDSSGYSNNGAIVGSLTAAAPSPRYDVATVFNGSSIIYKDNFIMSNTAMTLSYWINFSDFSVSEYPYAVSLANGGSGVTQQIGIWVRGGSNTHTIAVCAGGVEPNTSYVVSANTWYHIVETVSGSTIKLYVNGNLEYTATNANSPQTGTRLFVGARSNAASGTGYANQVKGKISDIRIYATTLTAQQIKELYTTSMSIDSSGNVHARELVEL